MEIKKKFEDVCLSLNMDRETADSAWSLYQKIDEDYGLEVSIYVITLIVVSAYKTIALMYINCTNDALATRLQ